MVLFWCKQNRFFLLGSTKDSKAILGTTFQVLNCIFSYKKELNPVKASSNWSMFSKSKQFCPADPHLPTLPISHYSYLLMRSFALRLGHIDQWPPVKLFLKTRSSFDQFHTFYHKLHEGHKRFGFFLLSRHFNWKCHKQMVPGMCTFEDSPI